MSRTESASTAKPYGLARVTAVWGLPRSTYYAQRHRRAHPVGSRKRVPRTAWSDEALTERIREQTATSPFAGEGHRNVWNRPRRHRGHTMFQNNISQLAFNLCALCNRSADLQASHIVPGFVFDWLHGTSATGYFRFSQSPNLRVQDGLKPRMLCWNCEQLFSSWEREFAEKCFVPINSGRVRKISYGPWMLKFATSVSWRVLRVLAASGGLTGFPDHILTKVNDALQEWARFLLGSQSNPGSHEQHMIVVDVVESASNDNPPPNISRYLSRTIEIDVAHAHDSAFSYAKMGRFVLFGFVAMEHPRRWKGTRLHVQQGRFGQQDIELPSNVGDYLCAHARFAAEKSSQISERQQTKIRRTYERDLDRAARSETLRAMHHDVSIFGTDAFRATQPATLDSTKRNQE